MFIVSETCLGFKKAKADSSTNSARKTQFFRDFLRSTYDGAASFLALFMSLCVKRAGINQASRFVVAFQFFSQLI